YTNKLAMAQALQITQSTQSARWPWVSSLVEPRSTSPSPMGISVLVVLISLTVALGDKASFASSPAVPPAAVIVEDRCPGCGVGHLQTIWRAARPGREERQRISILDSS